MVQKSSVDCFTNNVVAPEAKANIRNTTGDFCSWTNAFNLFGRLKEVDRVVVVFFHAGGDGQDVRVKDDVFWREADFFDQ